MQDAFAQRGIGGMYGYFLIIYAELRDIDWRNGVGPLVVIRIESDQSVDRSEVEFAVARFESRIIIELVAD